MLQSYEIQDSEISCDTTSVLTTPFSVKDILNMNINNDEYSNAGIKREPLEMHSQFWDNRVFTTNDYNYYCSNSSDNRHYWNSDNNVYSDTYYQQYTPNMTQPESSLRTIVKDDSYAETDNNSSKSALDPRSIKFVDNFSFPIFSSYFKLV